MWYYPNEIRIAFFSLVVCLFLLSGVQSSFSQNDGESFKELSEEDLRLIEEYLDQAKTLFEQRFTESAIFHYDKVLEIDSLNIDALNGKAKVFDFVGNPEEAISYYDKVLLIDPKNNDALNGKALALESLMSEIEPLPEISDEDLELLEVFFELVQDLLDEENYENAILFYDEVLTIDSLNIDALNGKALVLDLVGAHKEAISYYDKVLAIDSTDIDALNGKALALESLMSEIEPLPEISYEDLELLEEFFEQAQDLLEKENYEEAISFYDEVLAIESLDIDALFGKAFSLDNIGKHDEAISFYDKVLAIDSTDIDALNGKALALDNIGKHEEAISFYDKVLAIDSTDIDALFGKALSLESLGREEEAISNLEKIETLIPPENEFRVPPEGTVNQAGVEDIAEFDQTLFVIVGAFIVILIIIIVIDFIVRRRKSVLIVETTPETKQTILSKPSGSNFIKKENGLQPAPADTATDIEVRQAIAVLQNLKDMNMLDDPKTTKQFLLNKGFSPNAVKIAMLGMGLDPSHVTDL